MSKSLASRWSFPAILSLSFLASMALAAREPLSFEERVKAQEAIERVLYEHRIWPEGRTDAKPLFESAVTRAMLEKKVMDYLKKDSCLRNRLRRPIFPEVVQQEMERVFRQSQDLDTLGKLVAAGNAHAKGDQGGVLMRK